jgi:hypothetical protein
MAYCRHRQVPTNTIPALPPVVAQNMQRRPGLPSPVAPHAPATTKQLECCHSCQARGLCNQADAAVESATTGA